MLPFWGNQKGAQGPALAPDRLALDRGAGASRPLPRCFFRREDGEPRNPQLNLSFILVYSAQLFNEKPSFFLFSVKTLKTGAISRTSISEVVRFSPALTQFEPSRAPAWRIHLFPSGGFCRGRGARGPPGPLPRRPSPPKRAFPKSASESAKNFHSFFPAARRPIQKKGRPPHTAPPRSESRCR